MKCIAIAGPRRLTSAGAAQVRRDLTRLYGGSTMVVHVGDADGVDMWGRTLAYGHDVKLHCIKMDLPCRARYAERTTRMVVALAEDGGILHAWPNKPCPPELRPSARWPKGAEGSGTWGAVALAFGLGLPVQLHPLAEVPEPQWMLTVQPSLL
jgi:hypothetical protein